MNLPTMMVLNYSSILDAIFDQFWDLFQKLNFQCILNIYKEVEAFSNIKLFNMKRMAIK